MTASSPSSVRGTPAAAAWGDRLVAAVVFAASLGVLVVAAWLRPAEAGTGTHTQLGLPPCGFKFSSGLPCATCGMTTSFSHAANGDLITAVATQPAGTLLAVLTAITAVVSGWALVSGMSLAPLGRAVWRPRHLLGLIALLLVSWGYTLGRAIWL